MVLLLSAKGARRVEAPEKPPAAKAAQLVVKVLKPQQGQQERFLASSADICIGGGGAGGGKTFALLLEAARNLHRPGYGAVIFRRTCADIKKEGGLWDESFEVYPLLGGKPMLSTLEWRFPPHGNAISFAHMEHEKTKTDWQGAQVTFFGWDELTHFSESVFFYLMSRMRSPCTATPYVRATCNPDPDSWVCRFIAWWIGEDGFPIPERDGVVRWFIRNGDEMEWADSRDELLPRCKPDQLPMSVSFVRMMVDDNRAMLANNPTYKSTLHSLPNVEKQQLLYGNWKIRRRQGDYFKRSWFQMVDRHEVPAAMRMVRYWDRAATEPSTMNPDPDWTAGVLCGRSRDGATWILDVERFRKTPGGVMARMKEVAAADGPDVVQVAEEDPGQAGKSEIHHLRAGLPEVGLISNKVNKSKVTRALPLSAACEGKLVYCVRARWNDAFLNEMESFCDPDDMPAGTTPPHDDQVDGATGAYNKLNSAGDPRIRSL